MTIARKKMVLCTVCGFESSSSEEHLADTLALRGDERRDRLRKALGSCQ